MEQSLLAEILKTLKKNNFWTALGAWSGIIGLAVALVALFFSLK